MKEGPLSGQNAQQVVYVKLPEWSTVKLDGGSQQYVLGAGVIADSLLEKQLQALDRAGILSVRPAFGSIEVRSYSHIGRIRVGALDISVVPKIAWPHWLQLVSFALRLGQVHRSSVLQSALQAGSVEELLIAQFAVMVRELLARGVAREYVRQRRALPVPRGRVDFARIARDGGIVSPAIPSRFSRLSPDIDLNQTLLAGLRYTSARARDSALRMDLQRLTKEFDKVEVTGRLSLTMISQASATIDRRTRRYSPALQILELLLKGESVALTGDDGEERIAIPGFAFDMNRLWQQILSRMFADWSAELEVRDEHTLREIYRFSDQAPYRHTPPRPRPDFAAFDGKRCVGYYDAKYRDLWAKPLPREMLYQLSVYALAQDQGRAMILYPSSAAGACDQNLQIHSPLTGERRAGVILRPVRLDELVALVQDSGAAHGTTARRAFVHSLLQTDTHNI